MIPIFEPLEGAVRSPGSPRVAQHGGVVQWGLTPVVLHVHLCSIQQQELRGSHAALYTTRVTRQNIQAQTERVAVKEKTLTKCTCIYSCREIAATNGMDLITKKF